MSNQIPSPLGIPLLFKGKRVCIKGRFGVYPSQPELTDFLLAEGASVAEEISSDLDILILGKASARARKAAEELIAMGARIALVDDLKSLWRVKAGEAVKQLLCPTTRARFLELYSYPWLRSDVPLPITNLKLSGVYLRFKHKLAKVNFWARDCEFTDCCFDGVRFVRFSRDNKEFLSSNCKFARVRLANSGEIVLEKCRLEDVQGENISILALGNSAFSRIDASMDKLELRAGSLADSRIAKGHVLVGNAVIENCQFDSTTLLRMSNCNVLHLSVLRGTDGAAIGSSKLESTGFRECKFSEFDVTNCKFRGCYFENCQFDFLSIDSQSSFESFLVTDTFVEIAKCGRNLPDRIPGIQVKHYVPTVAECPSFSRLVDVVAEAERVEAQVHLEGITGEQLELRIAFWNSRRAWHCYYQEIGASSKNYGNLLFYRTESDRSRERDGFLTDFFRFAHKANFARTLPETLRVETSCCSVKSANFKTLFLDALEEVLSALSSP